MKLHKDTWLTKKRSGRIYETSNYILNNPEAFVITFVMGLCLTSLIFLGLGSYMLTTSYWGFGLFFVGLGLYNVKKLYDLIKLIKSGGLEGIMGKMTVKDFVFKK